MKFKNQETIIIIICYFVASQKGALESREGNGLGAKDEGKEFDWLGNEK